MRIHGQLTERDFVAAGFLHLRPRRSLAELGYVVLGLAVLAEGLGVYRWLRQGEGLSTLIELSLALCALGVYFGGYIPWRARKTYRLYKAAHLPLTVEVTPEGLHCEGPLGQGVVPWAHIHRWREGRRLFLLYPTDVLFYVVPKRFFESSDQAATFRSALEAHIGLPT